MLRKDERVSTKTVTQQTANPRANNRTEIIDHDGARSGFSLCRARVVECRNAMVVSQPVRRPELLAGCRVTAARLPVRLAIANGHTLTVAVAGGPDDNWRI